jgi:hypothetical protein
MILAAEVATFKIANLEEIVVHLLHDTVHLHLGRSSFDGDVMFKLTEQLFNRCLQIHLGEHRLFPAVESVSSVPGGCIDGGEWHAEDLFAVADRHYKVCLVRDVVGISRFRHGLFRTSSSIGCHVKKK